MGLYSQHLHPVARIVVVGHRHARSERPAALVWLDAPGRFTRTASQQSPRQWGYDPVRSHLDRTWVRPLERPDQGADAIRGGEPGDTPAQGRGKKIRKGYHELLGGDC